VDLRYSESEEAFRSSLRSWLAEVLPTLGPRPSNLDWPGRRAYDTSWQRMLFDAGYAGIDWPVEGAAAGRAPWSSSSTSRSSSGRTLRTWG